MLILGVHVNKDNDWARQWRSGRALEEESATLNHSIATSSTFTNEWQTHHDLHMQEHKYTK